jgi:hypothetical protein
MHMKRGFDQKLVSDNYTAREYGVSESELAGHVKRVDREIASDRKAGRIRRFKGNLDAALRH